MMQLPNILLLSTGSSETDSLRRILDAHVVLTVINDARLLVSLLANGDCDAVFCESSFRNAVVEQLQAQHSDLPVVIFSEARGVEECVEMVEAGTFDLLVSPKARCWHEVQM